MTHTQSPSVETVDQILDDVSNIKHTAALSLIALTGARPQEVLTLTVGDVLVGPHNDGVVLSAKGDEKIRLVLDAEPSLREWVSQHPRSSAKNVLLFPSQTEADDHMTPSQVQSCLHDALEDTAIDALSLHDLRQHFVQTASERYTMDRETVMWWIR